MCDEGHARTFSKRSFFFVYLKCARTLWHFLICSVSDVNKSTGRPVQPQEGTKNKQTTKNNAVVERAP